MTEKQFRKLVNEGIAAIPEKFLRLLDNVVVVVEDEPNKRQIEEMNLHDDWTLFGLYEGVPAGERGSGYTGVLPDKITIFKKPILSESENAEDIKKIVKDTVWHELAHHFGMDEEEVEAAEEKRGVI